jgi:hypothetical protein
VRDTEAPVEEVRFVLFAERAYQVFAELVR